MRIKVVIPNMGMSSEILRDRERMLRQVARPDTEISVECIVKGPVSIESAYDELLASPEIIERVVAAEREGYDATIVYCLSDPAVDACREMVSIPVIGPGRASMLVASALGFKLSIIVPLEDSISRQEEHVRGMGIEPTRLASVRSVGIPVVDLRNDIPGTVKRLIEVGRLAVERDGAQVLVLGCLGFANMSRAVQEQVGVPVVDPAFAAVNFAEMLHMQGLSHSRRAYPRPPEKERCL